MFQRVKQFVIALSVVFSSSLVMVPAVVSAADNPLKTDACNGLSQISGTNCSNSSSTGLDNVIATIINILSIIVGFVAVIMIIVGGIKFITSSGDSSNVASARNTILYAIIGLVIVALAQVIVHFVILKASAGTTCSSNGSIAATDTRCTPCATNHAIDANDPTCKKR